MIVSQLPFPSVEALTASNDIGQTGTEEGGAALTQLVLSDHVSLAGMSKSAIGGAHSSPNQMAAQTLAKDAFEFKKQGRLSDAADVMEEAFNKWPELRKKYAAQVRLWRCGISM
jgi:hypothetical protein